jgi:hypothetical protein
MNADEFANADTQPAPVAVCSCKTQYDRRAFDELELAAGHRGHATAMLGLIVRVCLCGSSVSEEVGGYDDDLAVRPTPRDEGVETVDRHDEAEWKEARAWRAG